MSNFRNIEYPADVVAELNSLRAQSEKGIAYLAETEAEFVRLDLEADRVEALSFLDAGGTVADRQAVAKLKAIPAREEAELKKVEVNRIKLKLRHLSEAMNATQTAGKMIELQWKTAGIEK
jgi:hypothetical protein